MAQLKKYEDLDFIFDPKPLTIKEKKMISDFIKADKERKSHIRKSKDIKKEKQAK